MVPIARMSPPESNVCFAISIDAGTYNSFAPIGIQPEFRRSGSLQGDEVCSAAYPGPRMQPTKEAIRLGPPSSCGGTARTRSRAPLASTKSSSSRAHAHHKAIIGELPYLPPLILIAAVPPQALQQLLEIPVALRPLRLHLAR